MKKTSKVATLLAMGALFLGGMLVSCNGVLDEAGTLNPSDPKKYANGTEVKTAEEIAKEAEEKKKNSSYTGPGSTDSWNFASQADTVDWVAKFKTNTITKDTDGTRSLDKSGNIDIAGASGSLTATILKDLAFKYGSSNSDPTYAYADPAIGFRIKSTGIKIANVKGKTQVKVEWVAMSSTRSLELYKGTDKKLISKEATGTGTAHTVTGTNTQAFDQEAITYTEDFGPGADLYLVATNNVFIKSITLTDKQGAAANPITALAITGTGVTNNAITLKTGLTVQLTRTATPADCDDSSVTWSSTNESVATVDTTGKVTAKAVGTAKIKATSTAVPTVVSNEITVTVPAIPRTVVTLFAASKLPSSDIKATGDNEPVARTAFLATSEFTTAKEPVLTNTSTTEDLVEITGVNFAFADDFAAPETSTANEYNLALYKAGDTSNTKGGLYYKDSYTGNGKTTATLTFNVVAKSGKVKLSNASVLGVGGGSKTPYLNIKVGTTEAGKIELAKPTPANLAEYTSGSLVSPEGDIGTTPVTITIEITNGSNKKGQSLYIQDLAFAFDAVD